MKFTLQTKAANIKSLFFIALLFLTFQSCKQTDEESVGNETTTVKVKLSVGSPEQEKVLVGSSKTTKKSTESNVQLSNVQISDAVSMDVVVIKDAEPSVLKTVSNSAAEAKAATQVVTKSLEPGVKYRVVVYDQAGKHKGNFDYVYGNESSTPGIPLDAGKSYTFIVYSVNSDTQLPAITAEANLSTASLSNISADLMYFKKTMTLTHGNNDLSAVLVHQFSEITTTIEMDASMTGTIETVGGTKITPTRASGNLKFSTDALTFSATTTNSAVSFLPYPVGSRSITSEPTFIISPSTTTASFDIGSIRLDAETKTNITVPKITITPGHKYNLILKFRTCTENVNTSAMNWRYAEVSWKEYDKWWREIIYKGIYKDNKYIKNNDYITRDFSAPQSNYGFVFDITELDNAFNMKVNDQFIFGTSTNDQIQFQTNPSLGTQRNIEFIDGTEYSLGGIDEVYNLKGTSTKPLLRIMISRTGEVTMLGSKTNGGELIPLRLKNNLSFKTVIWDSTGPNTVVVSQKVDGRTIVVGTGYGRKRIACPK